MDWLNIDLGLYYELAARWPVDAMLSGSETILAAYAAMPADAPAVEPSPEPQTLLVVVDSRGRIHNWPQIRYSPYWRDTIVLCSQATPIEFIKDLKQQGIAHIITGDDRVDLRAALEELNARFGVKTIRVDSGGALNGALLRAGLIDEVSVLITPALVGGTTPRSIFTAPDLTSPDGVISLKLCHVEQLRGETVWVRYEIVKSDE
jgi:2,5-diamino-6-(ribosylamino)-4(3H)-pyrimidinone 5'-phosphate reductase